MTTDSAHIIMAAVKHYGVEHQTRMALEEMAELQDALCKLSRGRCEAAAVVEEIADVLIMCLQLGYIYGMDAVNEQIERKLTRLRQRMEQDSRDNQDNQDNQD